MMAISGAPYEPVRREITFYVANCSNCQWIGMHPRETHVHVVTNGHVVRETRHHLASPMESVVK